MFHRFQDTEPVSGVSEETYYAADAEQSVIILLEEVAPDPTSIMSTGDLVAELIYSNAGYRVLSATANSCVLLVAAPDVSALYRAAYVANVSSGAEDLSRAILETMQADLENGNFVYRETEVEVPIENGVAVMTYDFSDALYGGLLSLQQDLIESYTQGGVQQ